MNEGDYKSNELYVIKLIRYYLPLHVKHVLAPQNEFGIPCTAYVVRDTQFTVHAFSGLKQIWKGQLKKMRQHAESFILLFSEPSGFYQTSLLRGTVDGAIVDAINDIVWVHPVHGAAHRLSGAEHLLHRAGELLGH